MSKQQTDDTRTSTLMMKKLVSFLPTSLPVKIYNTLSVVPIFKTILNKIILSQIPVQITIPEGIILLDQTDVAVSGSLALGAFENTEINLFRKCLKQDSIIVDIGARYNGYCSDMTRTFIFGKESKERVDLVNIVNNAQQYALDNIKAGINGQDIDKSVRDYFIEKNKEWGARFLHSLGHGIGIDIHENPYLSPLSQDVLEENMVVTVEPGLYIPGLGGARTEDQILVTKDSFISFTHSKKIYYR